VYHQKGLHAKDEFRWSLGLSHLRFNRLANIGHDVFDRIRVLAFAHYADDGFGSAFADQQATMTVELGFTGGDRRLNGICGQWMLAALEPDVLKQLR